MKITPFITAILVMALLFVIVLKRDALYEFAGVSTEAVAEDDPVDESNEDADQALIKVVVMRSSAQSLDNAVVLRGRTEAARQVEVRAETSGLVISEPLRKGTEVVEGDLLCRLNPGTRQAALAEAQGRLAEAQARLPEAEARVPEAEARRAEAISRIAESEGRVAEALSRLSEAQINQNAAEQLSQDGFASESRVANADASLESARAGVTSGEAAVEGARAGVVGAEASIRGAQAAIEAARAGISSAAAGVAAAERELDRLALTAPFSGLLETDTAELGALLQPGMPCATIIQLDPIKLVGFAPEADVGKITVGAMAGARLASGAEVIGQVTFLSRSADQTTRTFRVEVTVPNADKSIRDGQTADILVAAEGRSAHLLPQSSLTLNDNGELGVRLLSEGNVNVFAPITLLRDTIDGVWVSGLAETIEVIVVGQEYILDGIAVEPTYREDNG